MTDKATRESCDPGADNAHTALLLFAFALGATV
jgi:hypothetical protein